MQTCWDIHIVDAMNSDEPLLSYLCSVEERNGSFTHTHHEFHLVMRKFRNLLDLTISTTSSVDILVYITIRSLTVPLILHRPSWDFWKRHKFFFVYSSNGTEMDMMEVYSKHRERRHNTKAADTNQWHEISQSVSSSYYSPSWTVLISKMTIPGAQLAAKISLRQI